MGVLLMSAPDITRAPMRYELVEVNGRDGVEYNSLGYGNYIKELNIGIKKEADIDKILAWLSGKGRLTISNEPDKYYEVFMLSESVYSKLISFRKAIIPCTCKPFKKAVKNTPVKLSIEEAKVNSTVINAGSYIAEPTIDVTVNGDFEIYINGNKFCDILLNEESIITIDSENMECYKNGVKYNRSMKGEFPVFEPGENSLMIESLAGAVTKCEVVVNPRWL
jgi:phage-related protein